MGDWLQDTFGRGHVRAQLPLAIDNLSEPEPDLIVTQHIRDHYDASPPASDARLVVEIPHTTLREDTTVKVALYARASIRDYWVLDTVGRNLIVHRDPHEGQYSNIATYAENEEIAPLAAPDALIRPADFLLPLSVEEA